MRRLLIVIAAYCNTFVSLRRQTDGGSGDSDRLRPLRRRGGTATHLGVALA
jgi:hypothetical protein